MKIVLGRGNRRQVWTVTPKDYRDNPADVDALFHYVGLRG